MRSSLRDEFLRLGRSRNGHRASGAERVRALDGDVDVEYPLKRPFDVLLAGLALLISAPLWITCALAIKLADGGPVFHLQRRWGRGKQSITIHKFRSMVVDQDSRPASVQASADDPRVTRFGRFLRATSLDELPQILNIWRGEMSWVGPRPLPINEIQLREAEHVPDEAVPGFDLRCRARPGLTGIAQIYAPRDIPRRQKFRYDRLYIERQSLSLDARLICLSLWITFRGRWEHRGRKL
jgi:lipopolysaccharide/colanic/teichoic acid biosynthesis glycosyltransferase